MSSKNQVPRQLLGAEMLVAPLLEQVGKIPAQSVLHPRDDDTRQQA
jgi:hypothetical protein